MFEVGQSIFQPQSFESSTAEGKFLSSNQNTSTKSWLPVFRRDRVSIAEKEAAAPPFKAYQGSFDYAWSRYVLHQKFGFLVYFQQV